jgi:hypothetical protein
MTDNTSLENTGFSKKVIQIYLTLSTIGGIFTLVWILLIPGESTGSGLLGLSASRILLLCCVLMVTVYVGVLLAKIIRDPSWATSWITALLKRLLDDRLYGTVLIFSILGILNGINFITRLPGITEPVTLAYYVRLRPAMVWISILCGQTILCTYLLRYGRELWKSRPKYPGLGVFGLVLGILGTLTILVGATGYGLNPIDEGVGWYPLGTPLLVTQVFLAWIISMGVFGIWIWIQGKREVKDLDTKIRLDAVIGFLLWLAAFIMWTSQPLKPNWFASEPRPPNEAFYPNSDASVYDITAQNLALGEGFKTRGSPFTLRPMYATFLAVLHALGGPSYDAIIWMQVAVLAFIPVVIYNITSRIHNRFSGLLSALLLTFRETNAIRLGDTISDAHAKLLMPFLPTTLGILLIVLVAVLWLQTPSKRSSYPLVLGGLVGIFMLVRPEVGVLIPFKLPVNRHYFYRFPPVPAGLDNQKIPRGTPWLFTNRHP